MGAAMDEFERMAFGRSADADFAMRRIFWRLGDGDCGFELKAGVIGRGEDRHRLAVDLEAFLADVGFERLERVGDRFEGAVPGAGTLQVHDRLCGECRILAERIARLSGRAWHRGGRRRVGFGRGSRRCLHRGLRPRRLGLGEGNGHGGRTDAERKAEEHQILHVRTDASEPAWCPNSLRPRLNLARPLLAAAPYWRTRPESSY